MNIVKSGVRALFRMVGLDVRSLKHTEEAVLRQLLNAARPVVALDVGANAGQYARRLRKSGYHGKIASFEPLRSAHARLTQNASRDPQWVVAPCAALGSARGTGIINVSSRDASSSLLPQQGVLVSAAPHAIYVAQETVAIERLDTMSDGLVPDTGDLFLKIDAQGFELEILKGAGDLLGRITAMQLEMSLIALYQGSPLIGDVLNYTGNLGYELFHLIPGFRDNRTGRLLQVDGMFVRRQLLAGN